jgi:hypothetical protein
VRGVGVVHRRPDGSGVGAAKARAAARSKRAPVRAACPSAALSAALGRGAKGHIYIKKKGHDLAHPHHSPSCHSGRWIYQSSHACAATCLPAYALTAATRRMYSVMYDTPPLHTGTYAHVFSVLARASTITCIFCSDVRSTLTRAP